jgi:membrane-associated phospholipid phosphatase
MKDRFYRKLWALKDELKEDIVKIGDYLQLVTPLVFLIYVACYSTNKVGKVFVATYIICTVIQVLLKTLFNNPRPREVEEGSTRNPILKLDWSFNEGDSFPSGHTMSAMSGGVFWFEIGTIAGIIGIILGLFCGLSRIIGRAHWLRDVITSSVIAVIAYYIAKIYYIGGPNIFDDILRWI